MVESQQKIMSPELYERLIVRLGLALDAARTADRLRDERPAELELRGLSPAEFELIKAYLDRSSCDTLPAASTAVPGEEVKRCAEVIWLKDKAPRLQSARLRALQAK